ncbi:hypothetical protein LTS12_029198, partial [Elasticomyces elasticus]
DSSSSESKKTLLVWGGSSSVGSTTIQLATASGLRVVTTASRANFDYVRSLGAAAVFDYRSPTVVEDLVNEIKGPARELVGVYDAIGEAETSVAHLARVLDALGGDAKARFEVASVLPSDGNPYGLRSKFIWGLALAFPENSDPCKAIWEDFVEPALARVQLQAKPDPLVVGRGLEAVQRGLDVQQAGVSAAKVVISLV